MRAIDSNNEAAEAGSSSSSSSSSSRAAGQGSATGGGRTADGGRALAVAVAVGIGKMEGVAGSPSLAGPAPPAAIAQRSAALFVSPRRAQTAHLAAPRCDLFAACGDLLPAARPAPTRVAAHPAPSIGSQRMRRDTGI